MSRAHFEKAVLASTAALYGRLRRGEATGTRRRGNALMVKTELGKRNIGRNDCPGIDGWNSSV